MNLESKWIVFSPAWIETYEKKVALLRFFECVYYILKVFLIEKDIEMNVINYKPFLGERFSLENTLVSFRNKASRFAQ